MAQLTGHIYNVEWLAKCLIELRGFNLRLSEPCERVRVEVDDTAYIGEPLKVEPGRAIMLVERMCEA